MSSASFEEAIWDLIQFLIDYAFTAFDASQRLLYVPKYEMLTLVDELMLTRLRLNYFKMLSARKTD